MVFWVGTACSLEHGNQHNGGTQWLQFHGRREQHVPLRYSQPPKRQHGVTTQTTIIHIKHKSILTNTLPEILGIILIFK